MEPLRLDKKLIIGFLLSKKQTLSISESLTGGLLTSEIVSISNSSKIFKGGITAYTLDIKEKVLGIPLSHTEPTDGVDQRTAELMAKNVSELMDSDYGLSTTGIAERYDERPEQAYISLYIKETDTFINKHIVLDYPSNTNLDIRTIVRTRITNEAIQLILTYLYENKLY